MRKEHKNRSIKLGILAIVGMVLIISCLQDMIQLKRLSNEKEMLAFRALCFTDETIETFRNLKEKEQDDWANHVTVAMIRQNFNLEQKKDLESRRVPNYYHFSKNFQKFSNYYQAIFEDIECFPVGKDVDGKQTCFYENSWYNNRTYGGKRFHEGTDIMTSNNKRGYFPVYSMTDGIIEQKGWLKLGGWRMGIRSQSGAYFYYAHMSEYAKNLKKGDHVKAGQLIGYVGDTGYSEIEGTTGNFDVHLHVGMYLQDDSKEISINPYWVLKYIEVKKKLFCSEKVA